MERIKSQIHLDLLLAILVSTSGCLGTIASDERFRIVLQDAVSEVQSENISEVLSESVPSVMARLRVQDMPIVKVFVWEDRDDFAYEFGEDARNVRGFIDSNEWEVHLINLGAPLGYSALHEYVHLISLAVNENRGQIPLWLWESIAIYESRRPPPPRPEDLTCIGQNRVPTLQELNSHPSNIYRIGYLLAEFIDAQWNYDAFRLLLLSNGDVPSTFGITEADFEELWLNYILTSYNISPIEATVSPNC